VDDTIVFHQLTQENIIRIVDLMMAKLDGRMKDRDMGIELTQAAKQLLADRGYDPLLGARPLRRTIQREIEDPLSEKILFSELRPGSIVVVDVEGTGEAAKFSFASSPKSTLPEITTPADISAAVIADSAAAVIADSTPSAAPDSPAA
jgi:ATP-dependent Clp protease ATP-binding subunit ClpC